MGGMRPVMGRGHVRSAGAVFFLGQGGSAVGCDLRAPEFEMLSTFEMFPQILVNFKQGL